MGAKEYCTVREVQIRVVKYMGANYKLPLIQILGDQFGLPKFAYVRFSLEIPRTRIIGWQSFLSITIDD
jgi:hypothetical protein